MHVNVLAYERGRYGWYALGLLLASTVVYMSQDAARPPSGGTWQGYVLGTVGALLIVWLNWLGIRKRRYGSASRLQGWVSAHVYLGVALLGVALLHSAGQMGWNIHTATLLLMIVVIISGMVGVAFYLAIPGSLADIRMGRSRADLLAELQRLDESCLSLAQQCSPAAALQVRSSVERTAIGGGVLAQLSGRDASSMLAADPDRLGDSAQAKLIANRDQAPILRLVGELALTAHSEAEAGALSKLVGLIARRQEVLRRIRRDIQRQSLLAIWLFMHVPVAVALIVALIVHIVVVLFYW